MTEDTIVIANKEPKPFPCPDCGADVFYRQSLVKMDQWLPVGCDECWERERVEEARTVQEAKDQAFEEAIPKEFRNATLTDLSGYDSLVEAYQSGSDKMMFLSGPAGVGKTHALYALHRQAYADGRQTKFLDLRKYLFDLKRASARGDYFQVADEAAEYASFPGMLLLDDLGSESASKVTIEAVEIIITERDQWSKWLTVITSNLTIQDIASVFDDRIASRLSRCAEEIQGKDKRLQKGSGDDSKG